MRRANSWSRILSVWRRRFGVQQYPLFLVRLRHSIRLDDTAPAKKKTIDSSNQMETKAANEQREWISSKSRQSPAFTIRQNRPTQPVDVVVRMEAVCQSEVLEAQAPHTRLLQLVCDDNFAAPRARIELSCSCKSNKSSSVDHSLKERFLTAKSLPFGVCVFFLFFCFS